MELEGLESLLGEIVLSIDRRSAVVEVVRGSTKLKYEFPMLGCAFRMFPEP